MNNQEIQNTRNIMNIRISMDSKIIELLDYLEDCEDYNLCIESKQFKQLSNVELSYNSKNYELSFNSELHDIILNMLEYSNYSNSITKTNKIELSINEDNYELFVNDRMFENFKDSIKSL